MILTFIHFINFSLVYLFSLFYSFFCLLQFSHCNCFCRAFAVYRTGMMDVCFLFVVFFYFFKTEEGKGSNIYELLLLFFFSGFQLVHLPLLCLSVSLFLLLLIYYHYYHYQMIIYLFISTIYFLGQKDIVGISGRNKTEWFLTDIGCSFYNLVLVPLHVYFGMCLSISPLEPFFFNIGCSFYKPCACAAACVLINLWVSVFFFLQLKSLLLPHRIFFSLFSR